MYVLVLPWVGACLRVGVTRYSIVVFYTAGSTSPSSPEHYLFFACEHGRPDPTKPQKSWRTAWCSLRKVAGLPKLRFHDLRHQAITELAESHASDQTIRDIAGHVSNRMLEHDAHIRAQVKRTALDALASKKPAPVGYDTNQDTRQGFRGERVPQVIEKLVELVGIEPTTSSLRTMRSPS